jgi:hypothetical protein
MLRRFFEKPQRLSGAQTPAARCIRSLPHRARLAQAA